VACEIIVSFGHGSMTERFKLTWSIRELQMLMNRLDNTPYKNNEFLHVIKRKNMSNLTKETGTE
jgi:hypothetical protein